MKNIKIKESAYNELRNCMKEHEQYNITISEIIIAGCEAIREHGVDNYLSEIRKVEKRNRK